MRRLLHFNSKLTQRSPICQSRARPSSSDHDVWSMLRAGFRRYLTMRHLCHYASQPPTAGSHSSSRDTRRSSTAQLSRRSRWIAYTSSRHSRGRKHSCKQRLVHLQRWQTQVTGQFHNIGSSSSTRISLQASPPRRPPLCTTHIQRASRARSRAPLLRQGALGSCRCWIAGVLYRPRRPTWQHRLCTRCRRWRRAARSQARRGRPSRQLR